MASSHCRNGDVPVVGHPPPGFTRSAVTHTGVTATEALQLAEDRRFWQMIATLRVKMTMAYVCICMSFIGILGRWVAALEMHHLSLLYQVSYSQLYTSSRKKVSHCYFRHNFAICWDIFRSGTGLLSLLILFFFLLGCCLQKKPKAVSFHIGLRWNLTWLFFKWIRINFALWITGA